MGLLEKIFGGRAKAEAEAVSGYFKTFTAYRPVFTTRDGGLYEADLTRATIHAFASMAGKLKPEVTGSARPTLARRLQYQPNEWMDTTKFLYRIATILEVATTAFIVPVTDPTGTTVEGFFPILPTRCEVVEFQGEPWLRYQFSNGQKAAIEFRRVGILTKFQYGDDFFGAGNSALSPTLDLVDLQRQAMENAVDSGAAIRFIARLTGVMRSEDITKERDRFTRENLSAENTSGVLLFDAKYADVKQVDSKPYVIDAEQMALIKTNVFNYFGTNESILQNSYDEGGWNAYYEGKVEFFALQLGLVMTNMVFSDRERAAGNAIMFSSNRLQYASNTTKLSVVRELTDRGILSNHAAADVFNLPHPPGDERWVIRGEYIDINNLPKHDVGTARTYLTPGAKPPDESTEE